ncbi:hypothetical protein [Deinococcus multiflagellatus]|uniref:Uncharacterized protein n=1 Tax=Deinococcus multiflagellatus TaxID=1656887 RepID=A0ABW1ZJ01_9DEIO|nr:hypothetical protein [Deinococcus multiflagellatus]MBZ9711843.1 hypothetical protein [Deinococcus multiflagellatus]
MAPQRHAALITALGGAHPLTPALLAWAHRSPGFAPFLAAHETKVRRKLRQATGPEAQADLAAELALAAWLLQERRWTLAYEPLAASGGRGPDFRVAAPDGSGAWFLEVTRLHPAASPDALTMKLARTLADKAGQWPPGASTVLAAVLPPEAGDAAGLLRRALGLLQAAAGQPTPTLDGRAFAQRQPRLSAVVLCQGAAEDHWPV